MSNLETHDIQGIILSGFLHLRHSKYFFLHITDGTKAKAWLADGIIEEVTSARYPVDASGKSKPEWALNLAFTAAGIRTLGFTVDTFSQEFRDGIAEENRSKRLGDTDNSDPQQWDIGSPATAPEDEVHVCLIVQAPDKNLLDSLCSTREARLADYGLRVICSEDGYLPDDGREHFGFADAISEPAIAGSPKQVADTEACIQPGEFILGYPNEYGMLPATPTVPADQDAYGNLPEERHAPQDQSGHPLRDLGRNGTYVVFRKLHQDVWEWRRYFETSFPGDAAMQEWMQAKCVGRWHSGTPLVLHPETDPYKTNLQGAGRINNFSYAATDAAGLRCPVGAHIRRVNPRDSLGDDPVESIKSVNRHRLLRRGAIYGAKLDPAAVADDGVGRGVLFLAINTDIKRQFEFVQQTWINSPKFNCLYDERDPILGNHSSQDPFNNFTVQEEPVRRRLTGFAQFVTVKGGAYFFLPGIAALSFLAGIRNPRPGR
jgi:Dyp-type peroxidase family